MVFYVLMGLILWVFPDYSILDGYYSSMNSFFTVAPMILLFLIPALNRDAIAEELDTGTLDLLLTRPITSLQIVLSKFLSGIIIISIALFPSIMYVLSVYWLGNPVGNLDMGGVIGSYIGLFLLCSVFTSVSIFSSSLLKNSISSVLVSILLCFLLYWGLYLISSLPVLYGKWDYWVQWMGLDFHYAELGKGLVGLHSIVYFFSIVTVFLFGSFLNIERLKR
nr:ABC transporter permease subunit [Membranihabitans maritimus]